MLIHRCSDENPCQDTQTIASNDNGSLSFPFCVFSAPRHANVQGIIHGGNRHHIVRMAGVCLLVAGIGSFFMIGLEQEQQAGHDISL